MLTLFHAPHSRSTAIAQAIEEMGVGDRIEIRITDIPRRDGTGARDAANPHPDGKVPALLHDGALVTERPAILTYLSDLFPEAPGIRPAGHAERGPFLSWLAWYGDVMEPIFILHGAGIEHPFFQASLRGFPEMIDRLATALSDGRDYLLPGGFSTADLLCASPFAWFRDFTPEDPAIRAWIDRVEARPAVQAVNRRDLERAAA